MYVVHDFDKFKDVEYQRPNFKNATADFNSTLKIMKKTADYAEFKNALLRCEKIFTSVQTMCTVAYIRNTLDMNDKFYDNEEKFLNKANGKFSLCYLKFIKTLLNCPFKKELAEDYGEFFIKDMEMNQKVVSPKIIMLSIKQGLLCNKYSKIAALCQTEFQGEKRNFYGLLKFMQSTDREVRKQAFNAWADLYASVAEKLDEVYDELVKIRVKIAQKLNFPSFIDYIYIANGRYDYKREDVDKFREYVKTYIVPLCQKLYEKQRADLGVDKLFMYDEELTFKEGNAVPVGDKDALVMKAEEMYAELSPETGDFFRFMREHELFDLETRNGKHLGGYCTYLPLFGAPFIFSNFNGTSADVDVLTHEAGHAFQAYLAFKEVPFVSQVGSTSEICEIHSMTMEHFTYPYMDKFFGENADKYRYHHLVKAVECIPYLVCVDEFQHRVFEKPDMTAAERRQVWRSIEKYYMPWRDYDGNKFLDEGGFWMQKQHIFLYPFYYIDYALAQTCAFQLFLRGRENFAAAWQNYMNLCRAGGTKGYFDLLKVANLNSPFDENTVKSVAENIEKVIDEFQEKLNK